MDRVLRLAIGLFINAVIIIAIIYTHSEELAFQLIRLTVVGLGLFAVWSLLVAYRERHNNWTSKLFKIWACQLGWALAAVEGNIEFFYRHVRPSWAVFLVMFLLILTALGVFDPNKYTKDQP